MFFVYILKSISSGHSYIGATAKLPTKRLEEHNLGSNSWTTLHKPFTLLYYESYHCQKDALHREKFLKSGQGRSLVKLIIENYQAVSAKGGPASGGG
jgi:putative endonuclease